ncbi:odorant receptor 2a-like [Hermetia illucens]|nr:odorant receptor 2a-like [Hermetia illucens]
MTGKVVFSKKVVSSDAFKFHFKLWRILGVYPINGCTVLYVVVIILGASLPFGMTISLFFTDGLKNILSNLSLNITFVVCNLKYFNILNRRQNILDVNEWTQQLDARANSLEEQEHLRSAVRLSHKMVYLTCGVFTSVIISGELVALVSNGEKLMCPGWYPFDWQHDTLNYIIVHGHQIVSLAINILQNATNDTFPPVYMHILSSHMKTLNIRISRLGTNSTESRKDVSKELLQCIKDQQMLVEYFQMVRKVTSSVIFLQFFTTGVEACITGVCLLFAQGNLLEIAYLGQYFLAVIMEIFLYCYFGNDLVYESHRMTDAIYSCNWMDQGRSFKKILIIFMQSTQKSMTIMAGGFFPVNLSAFVSVLRGSYSLFAVLMRMT